jgi:hypothetical protein
LNVPFSIKREICLLRKSTTPITKSISPFIINSAVILLNRYPTLEICSVIKFHSSSPSFLNKVINNKTTQEFSHSQPRLIEIINENINATIKPMDADIEDQRRASVSSENVISLPPNS